MVAPRSSKRCCGATGASFESGSSSEIVLASSGSRTTVDTLSELPDDREAGMARRHVWNHADPLASRMRRTDEPHHRGTGDRRAADAEQDLARHQVAARLAVEVEALRIATRRVGT